GAGGGGEGGGSRAPWGGGWGRGVGGWQRQSFHAPTPNPSPQPPRAVSGAGAPAGGGEHIVVRPMASPLEAAFGAAVAVLFWSALGFAVSRRIFPNTLALPIAPALGWAAHSAATLPIFLLFGFSTLGVMAVATAALIASVVATIRKDDCEKPAATVPSW